MKKHMRTLTYLLALSCGGLSMKGVDMYKQSQYDSQREELIQQGLVFIPESRLNEYYNSTNSNNKVTNELIEEMNTTTGIDSLGRYEVRNLPNMNRPNPVTGDLERRLLVPNTFETDVHYLYFMRDWLIPSETREVEKAGYPWRVYWGDKTA